MNVVDGMPLFLTFDESCLKSFDMYKNIMTKYEKVTNSFA